jgi:hypothetical protein
MKTRLVLTFACASALAWATVFAKEPAPTRAAAPKPAIIAPVVLENFQLTGELHGDQAAFALSATAIVDDPKGGTLELISGPVALTEPAGNAEWRLRPEQNRFVAVFDRAGKFPISLKFNAAVSQNDLWKSVAFKVAPSALLPVSLGGLAADTQFDFTGAARPERKGANFVSYLPPDGTVKLSWKEAKAESEGKLFYAAEMLSQVTVSPGLMRQTALLDFKVMQGELTKVGILLRGAGEITRVQGEQVLSWAIDRATNAGERTLVVQFNQPQKTRFALQVQTETPLGAFPQTADVPRLRPENATRYAGYVRVVNEGAVRLEVAEARGLSQISPEQFPETDATRNSLRPGGSQRFAYRFSSAEFTLRVQADQIFPELSVSEVLAYHLAENELAIDGELELDIREAPLRELLLRVPRGYAIARLTASGLSDYFLRENESGEDSELRLVYSQPLTGRQLVQFRFERNKPLAETSWNLPRVDVPKAKSTRGHLAVAADAGFRLTPERTQGLTEIATAFFPRKVPGIQAAFRLSESAWAASVRVERLPQTVQAGGLHLFSIGEGVAYGSSVINYAVSGAPVSAFKLELSDEYFNVEFTGKDIRNWQKIDGGYAVQLHTPVSGAYTLLVTYERPFKAQGETLTFAGARPLDAQSEQGDTVIVSAYQFQVKPAEVSPGLLPLEPAEVPAEYRLFFDAPILAAYHYTSRPFDLKIALSPLAQGDSISQVVDRAFITNRISKEGQILTDVRYFVKNRGNPHFKLKLPAGTQLWSATVNGAGVVPVIDADTTLIPLPQRSDPGAVLTVDLKLAGKSAEPTRVHVAIPEVSAPVMLAEWKLEPDTGQRLEYRRGSLTPVGGVADTSGFAQVAALFSGAGQTRALLLLLGALGMIALAIGAWYWPVKIAAPRMSGQHLLGLAVGTAAFLLGLSLLANLHPLLEQHSSETPRDITFLAPVQQADRALSVDVANMEDAGPIAGNLQHAWPGLVAVGLWIFAWLRAREGKRVGLWLAGWLLLAWAALRSPSGAGAFGAVLTAFLLLQVAVPAVRRLFQLPPSPAPAPKSRSKHGPAPAAALLLLGGLIALNFATGCATPDGVTLGPNSAGEPPRAESVSQDVRVEDKFAFATATIRWHAKQGQVLPLLAAPAILTRADFPAGALKLLPPAAGKTGHQLLAEKSGTYEIKVQYQLPITRRDAENGIVLPVQFGLVNRLALNVANLDVEVFSPQAVSITRKNAGANTVAELVLSPTPEIWVGWKPRSRDVTREKAVFYAEISQLYAPCAGVIEGAHRAAIRPAQGELAELTLDIPAGATVTDVADAAPTEDKNAAALVSLWRFDPDARKLRITLNRPQSRPFTLLVRTQIPTGPLPFEHSVGLVNAENANGQLGLLGIATGNEVQLDAVSADGFSPINLEDFPGNLAPALQAQIPGLTVRRAFRYGDGKVAVSLKVSAVEPDVRVETQDTVSLGEDRTVLASKAAVDITRAGIFRLSFVTPPGYDVESISGTALSHWTESRTEEGRVITLNLAGKTQGQQQFEISLVGPGVKATNHWTVPQLALREAGKQRGTLLLVPEQGMRLQPAARNGLTQLDPQKSGIRQKGVLAFRILQTPWDLALSIEQVDPWVQVTSLQQATVSEALVAVAASLQYQIENTGLKAFRVWLPTNAASVRFQGEQVADFLPVANSDTNGLREWEIKLHRRVIGQYTLRAFYHAPVPEQATETVLRGLQAADVNLQRGFVTIQSANRLQVRVDSLPPALQATEWQSIPRALRQGLPASAANFSYRLVEPPFALPLKLQRHEAAKLLPARVNDIEFASVISDDGVVLTQVRLDLTPGDKRLLNLTLPPGARFWFAFVNQNGVWPWRDGDKILVPLEQSCEGKPVVVEIFYSASAGSTNPRSLDLALVAPKFDLPLENLVWRISLNDKWKLADWSGSLQLQQDELIPQAASVDLQTYLQTEAGERQERFKEAEAFMASANSALQRGDPQQARRAFQAAYGLSTHDAAFNEDARVQLHNIKLQQALVGLNVRQAGVAGDAPPLGGKLRDLRGQAEVAYTQQDAKDLIDRNSAEDNAAYLRLAERLIQQQDAAVNSPASIRASVPSQGRLLTFKRAVVVNDWENLAIDLRARAERAAPWGVRAGIIAATLALLVLFMFAAKLFAPRKAAW